MASMSGRESDSISSRPRLISIGQLSVRSVFDSFNQQHFLLFINLLKLHFYDFTATGLHHAANVTRLNREFAMSPVNQHQQLYTRGAAVIKKGIQRGAYGAARVENIIHEDDV